MNKTLQVMMTITSVSHSIVLLFSILNEFAHVCNEISVYLPPLLFVISRK